MTAAQASFGDLHFFFLSNVCDCWDLSSFASTQVLGAGRKGKNWACDNEQIFHSRASLFISDHAVIRLLLTCSSKHCIQNCISLMVQHKHIAVRRIPARSWVANAVCECLQPVRVIGLLPTTGFRFLGYYRSMSFKIWVADWRKVRFGGAGLGQSQNHMANRM